METLLRGLLQCDYQQADDYLKFAYVNHDMFLRNTRLWSMCSAMPRSKCYVPDTLARLCSLFPIHVMKVDAILSSSSEDESCLRQCHQPPFPPYRSHTVLKISMGHDISVKAIIPTGYMVISLMVML